MMPAKERVLLVELVTDRKQDGEAALEELAFLAATAGVEVADRVVQHRSAVDPAFYIGSGKAKELAEICDVEKVDAVIFDSDLAPNQVRNLEAIIPYKILDRSELIMDIFAAHARTAESKIQVELAQLNYRLPRLKGKGIDLSQLGAGIGTRGPGEKLLEMDRRKIRVRIAHLKEELSRVQRSREVQRARRKEIPTVALVGYTNAGKSTLLAALSRSEVRVEDKLFTTLDAKTKRIYLSPSLTVLMTDTVGFIDKLPPHLVASFRSTIQEATQADLLLHVVDMSHEQRALQMKVVLSILNDLKAGAKPILTVYNKLDLVPEVESMVQDLFLVDPRAVFISAKKGTGLPLLLQTIQAFFADEHRAGD